MLSAPPAWPPVFLVCSLQKQTLVLFSFPISSLYGASKLPSINNSLGFAFGSGYGFWLHQFNADADAQGTPPLTFDSLLHRLHLAHLVRKDCFRYFYPDLQVVQMALTVDDYEVVWL